MAKLAIKGHKTRGNEVIELLEMLGGVNNKCLHGSTTIFYYFIDYNKEICSCDSVPDTYIVFTLEEFLEKFPYKVGDKVSSKYLKNYKIETMKWEDITNRIIYKIQRMSCWYNANELQPYKEETMKDYKTTVSRIDFSLTNKTELYLGDTHEVVVEDGKTYVVRKKSQYPKTYKECCEKLGIEEDLWFVYEDIDGNHINSACISNYRIRGLELYHNLEKLKICRDAYWKIAGEEMGLGKAWEPDWKNYNDYKFVIGVCENEIIKCYNTISQYTLTFPTEEMRDAFYENFKDLIEQCKELL